MEQKSSKRKTFICLYFSWNDLLVYVAYDNSGLVSLSQTRKSTLSCLKLSVGSKAKFSLKSMRLVNAGMTALSERHKIVNDLAHI